MLTERLENVKSYPQNSSCRLIALDSQTQKCTSVDKGFNTLKENKYPSGIKGSNVNARFLTSSLQLHLQSVLAFVEQSKRKIYSKLSVCCCCYQSDYAFWSESQRCANCACSGLWVGSTIKENFNNLCFVFISQRAIRFRKLRTENFSKYDLDV